MENFIVTVTYLLIGLTLRQLPQFHRDTGNVLNLFVIYVSLPALVLLKIPELSFSATLLTPVVLPWIMLGISCVFVIFLARFFHWEREITGCLLLLVPLGNTSFLGIPMVKAFFGEQAIPYALLYDQLGSFLGLAVYGSVVIAVYGSAGEKPTLPGVCRKVMTFPPFIALLTAFILKKFVYPAVITSVLQSLAATLVPVVMIAVGFQLTLRLSPKTIAPLCFGLVIKLILAPLTAMVLCRVAGLGGEAVKVSVFEAGMPPMVSAGALAMMAGLSPRLTAALVGLGIFLSFVSLPILYQLL